MKALCIDRGNLGLFGGSFTTINFRLLAPLWSIGCFLVYSRKKMSSIKEWLKEETELVMFWIIGIGIVCFFLFSGGNADPLQVNVVANNPDFSFVVGTGETEGKEWQKVLKISHDDELLVEQTKTELKAFYDKLLKDGVADIAVNSKKQKWQQKSTNLIFDVTDTYTEGTIDKDLPKKRFENWLSFLEKNAKKYLAQSVTVWFLGAKEVEGKSKRAINHDLYTFHLKPYRQGLVLRVTADKGDYINLNEKIMKYAFEGVDIELLDDAVSQEAGCEMVENDREYKCEWWPKALVSKLKEIGAEYLSWDYSRGTYLLEYINKNEFDKEASFTIVSDGEFQVTFDVSERKLAKLDSDYRIGKKGYQYTPDAFTRDARFPKYRESAIKELKYMTDFCQEYQNTITFVGVSLLDNIPFVEYSESFFPKLFDGCNVEVK